MFVDLIKLLGPDRFEATRQMEDGVLPLNCGRKRVSIRDVAVHLTHAQPIRSLQRCGLMHKTSDVVTLRHGRLRQMGINESGGARNQYPCRSTVPASRVCRG